MHYISHSYKFIDLGVAPKRENILKNPKVIF